MAALSSKSRESTSAKLHRRQPADSSLYFEPFNTAHAHPGLRPSRSVERPTVPPSKHDQRPPAISHMAKPPPRPTAPPQPSSMEKVEDLKRMPAPPPKDPPRASKPSAAEPPPRSRTASGSGSGSDAASCSKLTPPSQWRSSPLHSHRSSSAPSPRKQSSDLSDGSTAISVDLKSLWSKPAPSRPSINSESDLHHAPVDSGYMHASPLASTSKRTLDGGHGSGTKAPTRLQEALRAKEKQLGMPLTVLEPPSRRSLGEPTYSPCAPRTLRERHPLGRPSGSGPPVAVTATISANTPNGRANAPDLKLDSRLRPPNVPPKGNGSPSSGSSAESHSALTPAGAVAEAYKQLEHRRDDMASVPQEIDRRLRGGESSEPTPYYTVFGSTTGKLVAVGGPDDDTWNLNIDSYISTDGRPRPPKTTPLRSLTKKASGKWKKVIGGGGVETAVEPWSPGDPTGGPSVFPGPQSTSVGKENSRSSPDRLADPDPDTSRTMAWFGEPEGKGKGEDTARARPSVGEPTGGRLWKLMKRISGGALRDKYTEKAPPPVPALPKDVFYREESISRLSTSTSATHMSMQDRTPMSAPALSRVSTSTKSMSAPRYSTTTTSSSPASSDVASSKFFAKTQSVRSSASSYDEKPPPVPSFVGQHIVPPSELYRLNQDLEDRMSSPNPRTPRPPWSNMSSNIDDWFVRSPEEERPSLPLPPPRRLFDNQERRSASPAIPAFSTANAVNAFDTIRCPPTKSSTGHAARPSLTVIAPPVPPKSSPHKLVRRHAEADGHDTQKRSHDIETYRHSNTSTVRPAGPREPTPHDSRSTSKRSLLTFRELGTAETTALTEQQKADKWDDLLERSARAGGTLHLGGPDLNARLSNYSLAGDG